jgi:WD40 repeat protein
VSASYDGTLKMWDVVTGTCIMTLRGHTDSVETCCLSSTDQFIISTDYNKTLKVWDVVTGNCTHTFPNFNNICAISEDDQRIVAVDTHYRPSNIRILHIKTGEILTEEIGTSVFSVCWSSDNQFLLIGTYRGVQIRDPNTLKLLNLEETDAQTITETSTITDAPTITKNRCHIS